jgi:hypothetical protein
LKVHGLSFADYDAALAELDQAGAAISTVPPRSRPPLRRAAPDREDADGIHTPPTSPRTRRLSVTATPATTASAGRGLERWAALGAVAYVVLFIVGVIFASSGQPAGDAAPAKVEAYFADSGHRDKVFLGWILVVLGVFFFLWFLAVLRQAMLRVAGDGFLTTLATIGGAV